MKNSKKIKEILVDLAADDKLPLDMNELDTSLFSEFNESQGSGVSLAQESLKVRDELVSQVIREYRAQAGDEPMDGDEVEDLITILRAKINLGQGNITAPEYLTIIGNQG